VSLVSGEEQVSDPVKIGGLTKTMVFDGDIFWDTKHENCDILRCHKKHGGLVRWGDAGSIIEPAMRDFQPAMELITSEYPLVI